MMQVYWQIHKTKAAEITAVFSLPSHGWKDVKEQIDHNVNLVLFQAPAGDNYTFDVNWSQLYGKLEPGEYRIVKPYQKGEAFSRDGETFYAFAEFTVGEK